VRALVTGSQGFVGSYLVKSLVKDGWNVYPFDMRLGNDIRDYEQVRTAVEKQQPEAIFHLAAVAWPGESITDPRRTFDVNVTGALNLLEAMRHTGSDARVLLAGTSEEYGYEGWGTDTITEDSPCRPTTPYGVTKLTQTTLGMAYARRHHLRVVATRAFNHTGHGRQGVNAESAFARRIVEVERGLATVVEHGNLSSRRNFTNVRDVVRAYRLLVDSGQDGIFNVGSDYSITMQTLLGMMIEMSVFPKIKTRQREGLGAPDRNASTFPDVSFEKIRALGWAPEVSLADTLHEVLNYWRSQ
jgi:GDP-4-dehydro-6-deoxy-D-mannose reductase